MSVVALHTTLRLHFVLAPRLLLVHPRLAWAIWSGADLAAVERVNDRYFGAGWRHP